MYGCFDGDWLMGSYLMYVYTDEIHKAFVAKLALDIQISIKYIFNYKLQTAN